MRFLSTDCGLPLSVPPEDPGVIPMGAQDARMAALPNSANADLQKAGITYFYL